jgi:hypothetical protein
VGVTWAQVRHWRVGRQFLRDLDGGSAAAVASRLCGVQAQVSSAAVLAVVTRQRSPDPGSVAAALKKQQLVRTWAMRGTLHLLTPGEAAGALSLLASARTWEKGVWQKNFVTTAQLDTLAEAVTEALADGQPKTRAELLEHVDDPQLKEHVGSGWSAVLKPLAWQGLLMQGPAEGGRITFVRPDLWLKKWPGLPDPDSAAPEVILRYLAAFGRATPQAFDQWLIRGVTPKPRLRQWVAALGDRVREVDVEGRPLVVRAEDLPSLEETKPAPVVRLLSGFDQFVLGPGTNDAQTLPPEHRAEVSRAGGWISPVIMIDGQVAGTWDAQKGHIATNLFASTPPLTASRKKLLGREVERVTSLLSRDLNPSGSADAEP